jgi:hypothetical protein
MSQRGRVEKVARLLGPKEDLRIRIVYVPAELAAEEIEDWIQAHPEDTERVIEVPGR